MLIELSRKDQEALLQMAIKKAGSERKLANAVRIPASTLYNYKKIGHRMPYVRFKQMLTFLELTESDFDFRLIDPAEYLSKGGKAVYEKYVKEGRFEKIHKKMRASSSKQMQRWHKKNKEENAENYYKLQYSRFKKVGKYKTKTKRGELVRNELEGIIANILFELKLDYQYEPFTEANENYYFPDFKIGNTIIECTAWKGYQKAYELRKKILDFEKAGFIVAVVIPEQLINFYKPIEKHIISVSELEKFIMPL